MGRRSRSVVDGAPAELKRTVGADTVVLQLEPSPSDGQVARVRERLDGLVAADAITPTPGGVMLAVANASSAIPGLLRRLDGDGVHIISLQMRQPSLDFAYETFFLGLRTSRRFIRIPSNWISIIFFPLIQLVAFSQLYKDIVQLPNFGGQTSYLAYLAPGQVAFTALGAVTWSAYGLIIRPTD